MRQVCGMRKLPPPSHLVRGLAGNEGDYVPLNAEESKKIVEEIEGSVEKLLSDAIRQATSRGSPEIQDSNASESTESSTLVKGKTIG